MYPSLRLDPIRSTWIDRTVATLADFACENRAELSRANKENEFPREIYRELGRLGFLGPIVPKEWGGLGGGVAEYVVIGEEVGRQGLVSGQVAVQGERWLLDWGTQEQKEQWLRGIATGELVFSESISEKNAGSSFKAMKSTVTRDGTDWILNGDKTHVNLGFDSDVTLVYALAEEGLTSFLVDTSLPGISRRVTDALGSRLIRTADVSFDHVRLPAGAILGEPGGGLQTFLSTFNVSRLGNASELIGLGRRALDLALDYAAKRQVGNSFVTDFQGIQWMLADTWSSLQAASLARDYAALVHDGGTDIAFETSTAKQMSVTAAEQAADTAFSMVGGHGLYFDQPYAEILNDIKVLKVAGGSVEVLRNFIARTILKDVGRKGIA